MSPRAASMNESGWDTCFVVDERRVVLGRLGRRAIHGREDVTAEQVMTLGPSTIRPSARLHILLGMLSVPDSLAAHILAELGVTLAKVEAVIARGDE